MKRIVCLIVSTALALSLSACSIPSNLTVNNSTPESSEGDPNESKSDDSIFSESSAGKPNKSKSDELKEKYNFYEKTVKEIIKQMKVTQEQADEIFIILVDCGLNQEPTYIIGSNDSYTVDFGKIGEGVTNLYVKTEKGVVTEVKDGLTIVYPTELTDDYIINNVTSLIESLNAGSSRTDYETAQTSFDKLTGSQQKKIPEDLVAKLKEYGVLTATLEQLIDFAIESVQVEKDRISINDNLGTGSGKVVLLYLKGSDNLTNKMIKTGMLMDTKDILQTLQPRDDISEITFFWSFPLVDAYGNTSEDTIMKINISKETLDKINFERFDYNSIPDIADDYFEHTALSQ